MRVSDPKTDSSLDSYLTIEPKQTHEGALTSVRTEGEETLKVIDWKGENGLVPKPGFEPGHP